MKHYIDKADVICHALSFLAVICVLVPLEMLTFFFLIEDSVLWAIILAATFFFAGYGMQTLYAVLAGVSRRRRPGMPGDDRMQRFSVAAAAGPVFVALLLSAGAYFLFSYLFELRALQESIAYYNADSPLPYIASAGMFLGLLLGIFLWFYPPERLATYRTVLGVVVGVALVAVSSFFVGTNVFTVTCAVCCAVLLLCALLLLNQAHITQGYRGSVVCILTGEDRLYNARLMLLMMACILLAALLCGIVIGGGIGVVRAVLFVTLSALLREEAKAEDRVYYEPDLSAGAFRRVVLYDSPLLEIAFYLFLFGGTVLLLFVLLRRQNVVRACLARIRGFIEDIIAFFTTAKSMWTGTKIEDTINYTDERKKIQRAAVRDYVAMAAETRTYAHFAEKLRALPTVDGQIGYAYMMLIRVFRERGIPLKSADTPRQVREKLHRAAVADMDEITEVLELVKYAAQDVGARGSETVSAICAIVKKYMA